jgi:hypothetical protein
VSEPFIIKTGSGGAIGLGKQLKGGRWMVDEDGVEALEELETYGNAGNVPVHKPIRQGPVEDERMPDEWNRTRNQEGEVVGFIGQRPIIRPTIENQVEKEVEDGGTANEGVMAALSRLRQQEKD